MLGVEVIPQGTPVVLDTAKAALGRVGMTLETNCPGETEWTTNAVSFRCEERIALGVIRPTTINIATGLEAG